MQKFLGTLLDILNGVHFAEELEVFYGGEFIIEIGLVGNEADEMADTLGITYDVKAVDRGDSGSGFGETSEDTQKGSFASAIGSHESHRLPLWEDEVDAT